MKQPETIREVIVRYPEREPGLSDPGYVEGGIVGELVRCKDCIWFKMPRYGEEGYCENIYLVRKTTFFCADGERGKNK